MDDCLGKHQVAGAPASAPREPFINPAISALKIAACCCKHSAELSAPLPVPP